MPLTTSAAATREATAAAVAVAARFGLTAGEPEIMADGANIIVHLHPAPVVAKVAASTPEVRPDVGSWLQRELDVALFLGRAGAPVMAPSSEVPAAVHRAGGHVMTFWRYLKPAGSPVPDEATIGSMLADLHAVLRTYPVAFPVLTPLQDVPAFLARPQTRLSEAESAALQAAFTRLTAELDPQSAALQVLHGDAGAGNLMATEHGWVWHDFEDTCSGPVSWDLAASTASQRLDGARILAAYGGAADREQIAVCEQLRRLHLTVWYALYAERLPQCQPRAAEPLASWPAP